MADADLSLLFFEHATEIEPRLYLGSELAGQLAVDVLKAVGVTTILIPAHTGLDVLVHPDHFTYYRRYVPDVSDYPLIALFPEFVRRIDDVLSTPDGGAVLVHCAAGKSRSAAVVTAYLMAKHGWTFDKAYSFVSSRRRCVSTKFEAQLRLWYDVRFDAADPRLPKLSPFNAGGR